MIKSLFLFRFGKVFIMGIEFYIDRFCFFQYPGMSFSSHIVYDDQSAVTFFFVSLYIVSFFPSGYFNVFLLITDFAFFIM